jgi:hypothetical protein
VAQDRVEADGAQVAPGVRVELEGVGADVGRELVVEVAPGGFPVVRDGGDPHRLDVRTANRQTARHAAQ